MDRKRRLLLLLIIIFSMGAMGISYAEWSNTNLLSVSLSSGKMNFEFAEPYGRQAEDGYFKVYMAEGNDESEWMESRKDMEAVVSYDGAYLTIEKMNPVSLDYLKEGDAVFLIYYAIRPVDGGQAISETAKIEKASGDGYDLGVIEFELEAVSQEWILESAGNSSISLDSARFAGLLPDALGRMHAYHTMISEGIGGTSATMNGVITIRQEAPLAWEMPEVKLSSLGLGDELLSRMAAEGDLHINVSAEYKFRIPLEFEQAH